MLVLASALLAFAPALTLRATAPACRSSVVRCAAGEELELQVVKRLQESFWTQKRARMKADMDARLRELDEFEAREAALSSVVAPLLGDTPALSAAGSDVAALQAELDAERSARLALEAELASVRTEAEIELQKVSAFWIAKLNAAKDAAALPAAAAAATAAPGPKAVPAAPVAEIVPNETILAAADLSLTELRQRLLSHGLSTAGLKSELIDRLEKVMQAERLKFKSWDSEKLAWV